MLSSWMESNINLSIGRMPSSASDATVGVDLNDLRMRDIAPLWTQAV